MDFNVYKNCEQQFVAAGTVIFKEKDAADAMYIIAKGRVSISKQVLAGVDKTLSILEEGEYFGEMSLLLNANRSATATALDDTTLIKLDRNDFKQVLREFPEVGMSMLVQLASRLEKANREAILLSLELALSEQKPLRYSSPPKSSEEPIIVATGSFEIKHLSEVLRRRKALQWHPQTKILASLLKPGQGQDALLYIIQTDNTREVMKLTSCFKDLVQWTISPAFSTDDESLNTLL